MQLNSICNRLSDSTKSDDRVAGGKLFYRELDFRQSVTN